MSHSYNPSAAAQVIEAATSSDEIAKLLKLGMTPRQIELTWKYAWYKAKQYNSRVTAWDGTQYRGAIDRESVAAQSHIPPGFVATPDQVPLAYRRPLAPHHLVRLVVNRFSDLLFGEGAAPTTTVADDPLTDEWVAGLVKSSKIWTRMHQARCLGGAMGATCLSFAYRNGVPRIRVHDPRWCNPIFADREELVVGALDIRYMYETPDPAGGRPLWWWYRRFIDAARDTVYFPAPVNEKLPVWQEDPSQTVMHSLGFCPVVWIQNTQCDESIDGETDCEGIYDQAEEHDALTSQASLAVKANCDPTLHVGTDNPLSSISKGSRMAIKTEKGGTAEYVEFGGAAINAAMVMADKHKGNALEVAQVVLEHPDVGERTATEVQRLYQSMYSRGGLFRIQYGDGALRLLNLMIEAARRVQVQRVPGGIIRAEFALPGVVREGKLQSRQLGTGKMLDLSWPPWVQPSLPDANQAASAVSVARTAGALSQASATKFVAPFFGVTDVNAEVAAVAGEEASRMGAMDSPLLDVQPDPAEPAAPAPDPAGMS